MGTSSAHLVLRNPLFLLLHASLPLFLLLGPQQGREAHWDHPTVCAMHLHTALQVTGQGGREGQGGNESAMVGLASKP